jgi:ubiquinone/menaquinone biosynthesis C-methylase UbiE
MSVRTRRRLLLPEMEGGAARRYARQRGTPSQLAVSRREARRLCAGLADGARILEVAPGPGYLAVEMARAGRFRVTGIDISRTMVEIAAETARRAGVDIDLRNGDVSAMPFPAGSFDLVVCQAAFKNFRQPVSALDEMHRVLRPGGRAEIQDLNRDATRSDIRGEVSAMGLGRVSSLMTRWILGWLRRRAYTPATFRTLTRRSAFGGCEISPSGIGMDVHLVRSPEPAPPPRRGAGG